MSYVFRSMLLAEDETMKNLVKAVSSLREAQSMGKYQFLAAVTEIATELAMVKGVSADDVFRVLANAPREQTYRLARAML